MAELLRLMHVSHARRDGGGVQWMLRQASFTLRAGEHLGILAPFAEDRAGICRLLAGQERPLRGHILRKGQVLWPPRLLAAFRPGLSARENLILIARICGFARPVRLAALCQMMSGIGSAFHLPFGVLPAGPRLRLVHALALALEGEIFLADENIAPAEGDFRAVFLVLFRQRFASRGLIFLSGNPRTLALHCNRAAALVAGRLVPCADFDMAARLLTDPDRAGGAA